MKKDAIRLLIQAKYMRTHVDVLQHWKSNHQAGKEIERKKSLEVVLKGQICVCMIENWVTIPSCYAKLNTIVMCCKE